MQSALGKEVYINHFHTFSQNNTFITGKRILKYQIKQHCTKTQRANKIKLRKETLNSRNIVYLFDVLSDATVLGNIQTSYEQSPLPFKYVEVLYFKYIVKQVSFLEAI